MTRLERLLSEKNIWLATTRPDGRPHLVPIWFVWVDESFFVCTESQSVKARNLRANPRASVALENGAQPIVAECQARLIEQPYPAAVIAAFLAKFEWDITTDQQYNILIALHPQRWVMQG
jgi:PPOX class probable F420-dependent enzyme